MAYLPREEIEKIGFASLGDHVFISDKVSIYNPSKISIGSYVRIDDFSLISAGEGGIEIGNLNHIACYACLIGHAKITLEDFVGISIKGSILSSTHDPSGNTLGKLSLFDDINADGLTDLISKPVTLEANSGIGAHTVVLPGVTIGKGSFIGPNSTVVEDLNPWGIFMGSPARFIRKRSSKAYQKGMQLKRAEIKKRRSQNFNSQKDAS